MRTLIIDDEEDTRQIASMSLSILGGVEVIEAEGGSEGISKAERERPDVILLDMMMPVMDGSQTLVELLKNPRTRDIPVIFLTAKAMSSEIERLKRMGAIGVLTKPFDPTTLAIQVQTILASKGVFVTPRAVPVQPAAMQNSANSGGYQQVTTAPQVPIQQATTAPQVPIQPNYPTAPQPTQPVYPNPAFAADQQNWSQQAVTSPYPAHSAAQYRQPYQNPFQQLANTQLPSAYQQPPQPPQSQSPQSSQSVTTPPGQYPYPQERKQPNQDGLEDWQIMPPNLGPEISAQQIISGPLPQMPDQPVCSRSAPPNGISPFPYKQNDPGVGAASGAYPQAEPKPSANKQYATTQPEVPESSVAHNSAAHLARIVKDPKPPHAPDTGSAKAQTNSTAADSVPGAISLDAGAETAAKKLPPRKKFQHPWGPAQVPNWSDDVDEPKAEDKSNSAVKPGNEEKK